MDNFQQLLHEASQRIQALVKTQSELVEALRNQQLDLFPQTAPQQPTKRTVRINVEQPKTTPSDIEPSPRTVRLLALIGQGHTTSRALAKQTGLSVSTVAVILHDMRSRGFIQKIGTEPTISRVVKLPLTPCNVYKLTDKGQTRLQKANPTSPLPAAAAPSPAPATKQQPSFEPKTKVYSKLTPRDKKLLELIRHGCRKATELSKSMNVSFNTTTQSLYILQRLGHVKIENVYQNRLNVDNRMSRHLVDRIAKPI